LLKELVHIVTIWLQRLKHTKRKTKTTLNDQNHTPTENEEQS
jgi:hypothetical protein